MKVGEQQCSTSAGDHLHLSNISPRYLAAHRSQPLPPLLLLLLHPPPSPFSLSSSFSSDLPLQPRTATPQLPSTKISPSLPSLVSSRPPPRPLSPLGPVPRRDPAPHPAPCPAPLRPSGALRHPWGRAELPPGERDRAETAAAGRAGCAA